MTEAFPFLQTIQEIPGVRAAWIERIPDLPITGDRDEAMQQLRPFHTQQVARFAGPHATWFRAEQIHGIEVAAVPGPSTLVAPDGLPVVPGVDGLITATPGVALAIYVADCGPIWLADRRTGAIGLLHSGKKGTEGNILQRGLLEMYKNFQSNPSDIAVVLGPCIRPPDYEVDFARLIGHQAAAAGVSSFVDCGLNTASDLNRFYSYRRELGKTGRMMALIVRDHP